MASSINDGDSRYVQGGDTVKQPSRLGWWERRIIPEAENDVLITIEAEFDRRPDKLAARAYGNQKYMWMILQYNNILDPNEEFITGKEIRLPLPERVVLDIMVRKIGGVTE